MKDFIFNTPTKVYFGKGKEKEVGQIIAELGYKKIMLQYGKSSIKKSGLYDVVINSLKESGIEVVEMGGVEPNPKIDFVRKAIEVAKREKVEFILAVGGGSVIDSCKYTALGAKSDVDVWEFSMGRKTPKDALKIGCVLTISAAGSEMSSSAVITNQELNMKKGCTSEFNRPAFAIMNPELTYTLPREQKAYGIVDIMAHTMERYFTPVPPTDLTDRIAESVLKAVISAGSVAYNDPTDYDAHATIMWASSLSHNGLTGAGRENYLAVHQLEHALSGLYDNVAHGAGLAVLFPEWAKYVYKYNEKRFAQFARRVWDIVEEDDKVAAERGIKAMSDFFISLNMPTTIREFGVPKDALEELSVLCTFNKTRSIKSFIDLDFDKVKELFESCY